MKRKNKNRILIEDDDRFEIYQIYSSFALTSYSRKFIPSQVCSPIHGTQVTNKRSYIDNKGTIDVDYGYDFIRKEEDKHISDEKLKEIHGTKYYEFNILNNKKINEIYGADKGQEPEKIIQDQVLMKETMDTFISSLDELSVDDIANTNIEPIIEEEIETEEPLFDEDNQFKLNIEDDEFEYNSYDSKPNVNIPSFLSKEDNNIEPKQEPTETFVEETITFDDIPKMKAPNINFDESNDNYFNPAIDKSLTIEEARRRYNESKSTNGLGATVSPDVNKKPEKEITINRYENYSVPFENIFKKSNSFDEEVPAWIEEKKDIINRTLNDFDIEGEVIQYTKGPTFTQYEIYLSPGVNVKKINQIYDNLQMNLQAKSIRVQAPIPGKPTVGVEVPNPVPETVPFGDTLSPEFINDGNPLNVAMGKKIDGSVLYQNIADMPHALIAGATQSGKSVSINTILMSLIIKNSPDTLRLILVDPKKVEFSFYEGLPHLCTPVITNVFEASEALKWACEEMDRRYDVFARNRCRKITEYIKKQKENPSLENMPYIVVVVDEFNDLVMQCGDDVNSYIIRLAQKARACGMHIILATQKPTVDVVNGTIKSNIPCRFAFRVSSKQDSLVILDEIGAEALLGRGDMLFKNGGASERAQGSYVDDDEIMKCCDYIVNTYGSDYIFSHDDLRQQMKSGNINQKDNNESLDLLFEIGMYCIETQSCSINSIQIQFNLGFNRASRIVTILEEKGVVSSKKGTKSRDILVNTVEELQEALGIEE